MELPLGPALFQAFLTDQGHDVLVLGLRITPCISMSGLGPSDYTNLSHFKSSQGNPYLQGYPLIRQTLTGR